MRSRSSHPRNETQAVESAAEPPVRQRIVAKARLQFFSHGFRGVTMDDLAAELGMSKKTLYAHFPSKAALLEAVAADKFSSVEADLEHITSTCPSASPAGFLAILQQLLMCLQRHTDEVQPSFVRDVRRGAPELFKLVESRRRDLIQHYFGKVLDEGQRAGIIRRDIAANLIMEILLGAVQSILNPARMEELDLTLKTGFSIIITVILEGVVTEQGRAKL